MGQECFRSTGGKWADYSRLYRSEVAVIRRSLADGEATAVQEAAGPDAAKDKALLHPKAAMHTNTYDAHLRRLCLLAGFKQTISSHRLRSFFITEALSAGIPLHMVQYAVGHRIGSDTWKRYISKRVNIDVMSIILGSKSQRFVPGATRAIGLRA